MNVIYLIVYMKTSLAAVLIIYVWLRMMIWTKIKNVQCAG